MWLGVKERKKKKEKEVKNVYLFSLNEIKCNDEEIRILFKKKRVNK